MPLIKVIDCKQAPSSTQKPETDTEFREAGSDTDWREWLPSRGSDSILPLTGFKIVVRGIAFPAFLGQVHMQGRI